MKQECIYWVYSKQRIPRSTGFDAFLGVVRSVHCVEKFFLEIVDSIYGEDKCLVFENRVDVEAIARHEVNVLYGLGGCRQILGKEIADVAYKRGYSPTEKG